jgi:hypothetical protein
MWVIMPGYSRDGKCPLAKESIGERYGRYESERGPVGR